MNRLVIKSRFPTKHLLDWSELQSARRVGFSSLILSILIILNFNWYEAHTLTERTLIYDLIVITQSGATVSDWFAIENRFRIDDVTIANLKYDTLLRTRQAIRDCNLRTQIRESHTDTSDKENMDWGHLPILKLKTWLEQTAFPPYSMKSSIWTVMGKRWSFCPRCVNWVTHWVVFAGVASPAEG